MTTQHFTHKTNNGTVYQHTILHHKEITEASCSNNMISEAQNQLMQQ